MRIAIVIARSARMDASWTTVHLAAAAATAGHDVAIVEANTLEVSARGRIVGRAHTLAGGLEPDGILRLLGEDARLRYHDLERCDALWLRINPLSDALLALVRLLQLRGVSVVNDPMGIAATRSKAWVATLHDVPRPATLVTASPTSAELFARNVDGDLVIKPMIGSGGHDVVRLQRHDLGRLRELVTRSDTPLIVQQYLPEASLGEKRLFWVDGAVLGAYRRQRQRGEFRHNLKQGAHPEACVVDSQDIALVHAINPHLRANGIRVAGLDVMGGRLVEVNTVNPGGVHHAARLGFPDLAHRVVHQLSHREAPEATTA